MFDPRALLAMLRAFYPICSPAELARAKRERPEYFGGGEIIGRMGDALRLPSGEVWDLIFNVDNPIERRWQAIRPGAGGPRPDDPFALEEGGLAFLEPDNFPRPGFARTFETLVAQGARALAGSDTRAGGAVTIITAAASPAGLDTEYEQTIGLAARDTHGQLASLHTIDPAPEIRAAGELEAQTLMRERDYPDPYAAPASPPSSNPGPPPPREVERPPKEA